MIEKLDPYALTTPQRVGLLTNVRGASPDKLNMLINIYCDRIRELCSLARPFYSYTTDSPLVLKGSGETYLYVPNPPIKSVSSVQINGVTFAVQTVDSTVPFPLLASENLTVYRTPEWDLQGKLYCPFGWTMWSSNFRDLSGDPDLLNAHRLYNVTLAMTGGYILPQWSGTENATYNPTGAPADLPRTLEKVIADEIGIQLSYPNRHLQSQRSPGGSEQRWKEKSDEQEWCANSASILAQFMSPQDRWR